VEGPPTERVVAGRAVRYRPITLRRDQRRASATHSNGDCS
jgi:hypothetical protein